MRALNETHNRDASSWLESARDASSGFPVQNLPLGVFHRGDDRPRPGVAIGDQVLDLAALAGKGLLRALPDDLQAACREKTLNSLMALGTSASSALRGRLSELLCARRGRDNEATVRACLVSMREAVMCLPAAIGDYSDFYASIFHATNVGTMLRPDSPLLPNYKYVPIGYHGRSSSIVVSGTPIRRPRGQLKDDKAPAPDFGPSKLLDYELELGLFVGQGSSLGETIPLANAEDHLFGVCLLNDWSARDIQKWEYQPLGPFLAKSFATSIAPWIVTMEALAPFRVPAFKRANGDPAPLPYLSSAENQARGGIAISLEVFLMTEKMRKSGLPLARLGQGQFQDLYWTPGQILTHQASNGCNLRPGDLLGSGTVSGQAKDSRGCLLELTWRGAEPLQLQSGEERRFLLDGDEVILRGYCEREGFAKISLGECRAVVEPAAAGV